MRPPGFREFKAPFDEQDLGLDLGRLARLSRSFRCRCLWEVQRGGDRFALGGVNAALGFRVEVAVFVDVALCSLSADRRLGFHDHVGWLDVRAEGRVGQDDVEAVLKDAIDVDEAIVVMHAAVAVAVHDHVHFAGTGHAVVGVGAVDTAVG